MGFESMIPASEQVNTVHALERLATVTGKFKDTRVKNQYRSTAAFPQKSCSEQSGSYLILRICETGTVVLHDPLTFTY
jgi:hypothetical protein